MLKKGKDLHVTIFDPTSSGKSEGDGELNKKELQLPKSPLSQSREEEVHKMRS